MTVRPEEKESLSMSEAASDILEECRMVLPGIQALFGFQLIAVINSGFSERLREGEQLCHLVAIGFVAIAVALVMAPAAYHRQTGIKEVSGHFLMIASRLLLWSMIPLMFGVSLDFYIIARLILHNEAVSAALAAGLLCVFASLWFLLPRCNFLRNILGRED
ncbi:DUF6328 family protein [Geomonas sp. RF6]|uniref:DUF6328 family protein n=1 Tax=Geomonas sp. RF6 TaxID=2897342 RepID=UPI001E389CA5|nr:DUF6328 family protein [Geomonas sp. RF6]UFS71747.1 DUF6328 family protein [Geomonas sp. RF6]